jgi:hypothetical protein
MSQWEVFNGHVMPLDDLKPHIAVKECWCNPTPDEEAAEVLVHHSLDKREEFERGERKPT